MRAHPIRAVGCWLIRVAVFTGAGGAACRGESDDGDADALGSACVDAGTHLRGCGLLSDGPIECSSPRVEAELLSSGTSLEEEICQLDCIAAAECADLEGILCAAPDDSSIGSPTLDCFFECARLLGFRCAVAGAGPAAVPGLTVCDGEGDCEDGSDERDCTLVSCGDGLSVPASFVCDGFFDCGDGRDEAMGCPMFACADGSTVSESFQCDGEADCLDGSDETGCPARATVRCGP